MEILGQNLNILTVYLMDYKSNGTKVERVSNILDTVMERWKGCNNLGVKTVKYTITMKQRMEEYLDSNERAFAFHWIMKKFNMQAINILLVAMLVASLSCTDTKKIESKVESLPYYTEATFTPQWLSMGDSSITDLHQVSSFSLVNQDGKEVTEKMFEDKIYITDFFFTICPGICPKMTKNMAILQDEFLEYDDVLLLSHSVTPHRDSVPILKAYAEEKGVISNKWHLVTGTQEEIYRLGRKDYFVEEDLGLEKEIDEFLHTENFVLIDKNRHIRGIYNGLNLTSINQLIADVKTLKREG